MNVTERILYKDIYGSVIGDAYTADKLSKFVSFFAALLQKVPEQYRDTATVEIDSVGGYEGEHHAEIIVSYERPETEAEKTARLREEAREREAATRNERGQYERLRAKFEPNAR